MPDSADSRFGLRLRSAALASAISLFAFDAASSAATQTDVAIFVRDVVLGVPDLSSVGLWMTDTALDGASPLGFVARDIREFVPDELFPFPKTWLVMIDDVPDANWGHSCRWVFVDEDVGTGQLTGAFVLLNDRNFSPTVFGDGGLGLPANFGCYSDPALMLSCTSLVPPPVVGGPAGGAAADNPCLHAVLMSGGWNNASNYGRYAQNLKSMFVKLRAAGFGYNQIWVYYADGTKPLDLDNEDGDGDDTTGSDVDGGATLANIQGRITQYVNDLADYTDVLFIYGTNHGIRNGAPAGCNWGRDGLSLWDLNGNGKADANEVYTPAQLAADTADHELLRLHILMDQCFSGLFAPIATDGDHDNTDVFAAATADCFSYGRQYMAHWEALDINTKTMRKMHPTSLAGGAAGACPCTPAAGTTVLTESKAGIANTRLNRCGANVFAPNDLCENALLIPNDGTYIVGTEGETTDGPTHPECVFAGQATWDSDVWFTYRASCTGELTIDTCGSETTFDTRIAVYEGAACPTDSSTLLACNEDSPDCTGGKSKVTICAQQLNFYKIRLAGYKNAVGYAELHITCWPRANCACPADLNGDFLVNATDLGILLGEWGPHRTPSGADFNCDGAVDAQDLGILLTAWGTCL